MHLIKKISAGVISGSLIIGSLAPVAFADVTITDNGNNSTNTSTILITQVTTLTQTNTSIFTNDLDLSGRTGNNTASNNTGADVTIDTGNVTNTHDITNTGGGNSATITKTPPDPGSIVISDNGNGSSNGSTYTNPDTTTATQGNTCIKTNTVKKKGRTGRNRARNNTGGTVDVTTGNVNNTGSTTNTCNSNVLTIP